jgi:hypothetical protein
MAVPGQIGQPEDLSPPGSYATRAEVISRLEALTSKEKADLRKWARYIARKSENRIGDEDDLYNTAILKMLLEPPERKWYPPQVEFFPFVMGCIKSIGNSWVKSAKNSEPPGVDVSGGNEQKQREASIVVDEMRAYLAAHSHGHPHAVEMLDLIGDDYTGTEIQKRLGIAPHVYEATLKWIRRTLKRREGYRP